MRPPPGPGSPSEEAPAASPAGAPERAELALRLVADATPLEALCARLRDAARVYLDTEFDSSRRGHRLSLIQLRVDEAPEVWLVDALARLPLDELGAALCAPGLVWVLHAGRQDVLLLGEHLALPSRPHVLDTQVGWSLCTAEHQVSFAHLVYHATGARRAKRHQTDDWLRRPLPRGQLRYAADDVAPLPAIEAHIAARLGPKLNYWETATSEVLWPEDVPARRLTLGAVRNAWQLPPPSLAALRAMIAWANERAERGLDAPSAKALFAVAARMPESIDALVRLKGVSPAVGRAHGPELLRAVELGRRTPCEAEPTAPAPYGTFTEARVSGWLSHVRAEVATRARVALELAFPPAVAREMDAEVMARGDWQAALLSLSGWRGELFSTSLREHLERAPEDILA